MKHVRFQAGWCGASLLSLMPCSSNWDSRKKAIANAVGATHTSVILEAQRHAHEGKRNRGGAEVPDSSTKVLYLPGQKRPPTLEGEFSMDAQTRRGSLQYRRNF